MSKVRKAKYIYKDGTYFEVGGDGVDQTARDAAAAAQSTADSKSDKAVSFTATLLAASWSNKALIVNNALFLATGFAYIVSPASASFAAYGEAQIHADDVTTDGVIVFHCSAVPSSDLTVNVVRMVSA